MSSDKRDRSKDRSLRRWARGLGSSLTGKDRADADKAGRIKSPALSSSSSSGPSSSSSSSSPTRVDLQSTLQLFGSSSNFNLNNYLSSTYSTSSPAFATQHKQQLLARKEQTSEELKRYVTRHYPVFIQTTKEIITIEQDMANLSSCLSALQQHVQHLATPSFTYQDEKFHKRHNDMEASVNADASRVLNETLVLEEWNEDLRGWIYERKFEKAVRIVEKHWARNQQNNNTLQSSQPSSQSSSGSSGSSRLETELDLRVIQLVDILTYELQSQHLKKNERKRIIQWLIRLGESMTALQMYLQYKSQLIRTQVRALKVAGDLVLYITDLSTVVFSHLVLTCVDVQTLFVADSRGGSSNASKTHSRTGSGSSTTNNSSSNSSSGGMSRGNSHSQVMLWVSSELQYYCEMFAKQVLTRDHPFSQINECLRAAFQCCSTIEQQGLSLSLQIASALTPPLTTVITEHYSHYQSLLQEQLQEEQWRVNELWVHDRHHEKQNKPHKPHKRRPLKLTSSAKYLYEVIRTLLKDLIPLLDPQRLAAFNTFTTTTTTSSTTATSNGSTENNSSTTDTTTHDSGITSPTSVSLYTTIITGMINLFESYLISMANASNTGLSTHSYDDLQLLSIIANCFYLADDLLPRVGREFLRQFTRVIPELEVFGNKLGKLYEALQSAYCAKRTIYWIERILQWEQLKQTTYANPTLLARTPTATNKTTTTSTTKTTTSGVTYHTSLQVLNVTGSWCILHDYFVMLRMIIGKCLSPAAIPIVLSVCFEELFLSLLEQGYIQQVKWGYGGALQFTRDVWFFRTAMDIVSTERMKELAALCIQQACRQYCTSTNTDEKEMMQQQEKQQQEINSLLQKENNNIQTMTRVLTEEQVAEERRKQEEKQKKKNNGKT